MPSNSPSPKKLTVENIRQSYITVDDERKFDLLLRVMEREKSIIRVAPDMYFLAESIDKIRGSLREHLAKQKQITPAAFRDLLGTSRKYTIPLLEYFDREGMTIRTGDARRLRN